MVINRNRAGLRDWLVQRVTAVILGIYTFFIIIYLATTSPLSYDIWHQLFSHLWMKMFTFVVVLSILWHAWIGLWTVFTDYVKNRTVRIILETIVCLLLLFYVVWMFEILW